MNGQLDLVFAEVESPTEPGDMVAYRVPMGWAVETAEAYYVFRASTKEEALAAGKKAEEDFAQALFAGQLALAC